MSDAINPYAAPEAPVADVAASEAEAIRREHISHESSVLSIGMLYYLTAAAMTLGAVVFFALPAGRSGGELGLGVFTLSIGLGLFALGRALRDLKRWARVVAAIFSVLGLLGFPIGTLINGYILYLLFSKKGGVIFSEAYRDVIKATPHVKYGMSVITWIFIVLLVLFLLGITAAIVIPMFAGR